MDFLSNLRLRSLFGGPNPPPTPYQNISFAPPSPEASDDMDIPAMMNKIYQPEHVASDRYNELVSSMPTSQSPSFLRTLAASLTAFGPGGMAAADKVIDQPNIDAMNDWKAQIGPAQHAAEIERQNNVNERTLAYQTVSQQLRAKADEMKNLNNKANTDIKAHRAAIYEFKATHPNWKLVSPKGGNVIFVNPANPQETHTVTDENGQPVPTGSLTDTDKINLQHDNKMEEIETNNKSREGIAAANNDTRQNVAETRGWQVATIPDPSDPTKQMGVRVNQITGETVPIKFGDKPVASITKPGTNTGTGVNNPANLQKVQDQAREALNVISDLIDDKDQLTEAAKRSIGPIRMTGTHKIPGSVGYKGDVAIQSLKAKQIISLIGEMKAQSKTGATGFGALNMKELSVLEDAATRLDPLQDQETFKTELIRIREKIKKILQPANSGEETRTPAKLDAAALLKKYGPPQGVQ